MFGNKKGFVLESAAIIWIVGALVVGAVAIFQGKAIAGAITGSDRNTSKQTSSVVEKYTMGRIDAKGNFVKVGDYSKSDTKLNLIAEQPPETLWQKFWHLGFMAVVIIVILTIVVSYLGAGPLIQKWINNLKAKIATAEAEKLALHDDAKLIVQSVDAGLQTLKDSKTNADLLKQVDVSVALDKARTDFLTAMDGVQDTSTKALVHELLKND